MPCSPTSSAGCSPIVYAFAIEQVISRHELTLIPALALCFAMMLVANEGMFALGHVSWVYKVTDFDSKLRRRIFRRILSARSELLDRRKTGDLAETVASGAHRELIRDCVPYQRLFPELTE